MESSTQRRIAIIGAGISGLLACKHLNEKGFNPIIFEAKAAKGGIWTNTVEATKLQTPRDAYQFSDFPWPSSVEDDFPNTSQVLDYIESYASEFGLHRCIKYNCRVTSIEYQGASDEEMSSWDLWGGDGEPFSPKGVWNVTFEDGRTQETEVYEVEFVILCIGQFSDLPNIPHFPPNKGPEIFDGKVIHSMDYSAMENDIAAEFIKGKRVTVVGFQKSAVDIANEVAIANGLEHPCTVLYRTEHWLVPNFLPWGFPLGYLFCNRFAQLMVHKPGEGLLLSLLATLLSPVRWAFSKFVESHIRWKFPMKKYNMIPKHSFAQQISTCLVTTAPDGFYDRVEEGNIILKKAKGFSFHKEGLTIDGDATPLETDIVILATGYNGDEKLKNIFASSTFKKYIIGSPNTTLPLYRECIHPRIPQLAIIGYSESLSNLHTSEMRCRWIAHLIDGTFKLPRIKTMEDDALQWESFLKRYTGNYYRRACIGILQTWYNDLLCKDMGYNHKRKNGVIAELFQPYGAMDYKDLS